MKIIIWIARKTDNNSDVYKAFFDRKAAEKAAYWDYYASLTFNERKTHTVTVEGYPVEVADGDTRTAEELFNDLCLEDNPDIYDPTYFEEIRKYKVEFVCGQGSRGDDSVNYMSVNVDGIELYAEEAIPEEVKPDWECDINDSGLVYFAAESRERLKAAILEQANIYGISEDWLKFI